MILTKMHKIPQQLSIGLELILVLSYPIALPDFLFYLSLWHMAYIAITVKWVIERSAEIGTSMFIFISLVLDIYGSVENAECGVWKVRGVENVEHFNFNMKLTNNLIPYILIERAFYNIVTLAC